MSGRETAEDRVSIFLRTWREHGVKAPQVCVLLDKDDPSKVVTLTPQDLDELLDMLAELKTAQPATTPLTRHWKEGERVELVSGGYSGIPKTLTPGVVAGITAYLQWHERLWVLFDGEEVAKPINPDVIRHRKEAS